MILSQLTASLYCEIVSVVSDYLCIARKPDARLRSKMGDMGKDFLKIVYESTTNIRTKLKRNKSCRMFATLSLFDHNCQDAHRLSTTRTVNFTPPHLFPSFCRKRNLSSILSRLWKLLTCLSYHFLLIIHRVIFWGGIFLNFTEIILSPLNLLRKRSLRFGATWWGVTTHQASMGRGVGVAFVVLT